MVHTPASRSISSHVARRISPERAAVSTRNSNASLVVTEAWEARTVARASATAPWGSARMCWTTVLLPPERLPEGIARRVVRPVAHGDRPLHHGTDPLPHPPCGLGLVVPDRGEDGQHVGRGHRGHGHRPDARERIGAQTARPVPRVLGIAPAGALLLQHRGGGLLDRGRRPGRGASRPAGLRPPAPAGGWRTPRCAPRPVTPAGSRRARASGPAPNDQPLHPLPRPGRIHAQVQPVAVAIEPGLGGTHKRGAQAVREAARRRGRHRSILALSLYS